jgi:hypothetical protein
MVDQWYYGAEGSRQGPFSPRELLELANSGRIRPTDTVWKEGVPTGVPAHRVKNLFPRTAATSTGSPAAPASVPDARTPAGVAPPETARQEGKSDAAGMASAEETSAATADVAAEPIASPTGSAPAPSAASSPATEEEVSPARTNPPKPPPKPTVRKGRATVVRGAVIAGQDGEIVYFRKKCVKCGHEETGRSRLPIRNGITRSTYFCPKCRRPQPVEIQGQT